MSDKADDTSDGHGPIPDLWHSSFRQRVTMDLEHAPPLDNDAVVSTITADTAPNGPDNQSTQPLGTPGIDRLRAVNDTTLHDTPLASHHATVDDNFTNPLQLRFDLSELKDQVSELGSRVDRITERTKETHIRTLNRLDQRVKLLEKPTATRDDTAYRMRLIFHINELTTEIACGHTIITMNGEPDPKVEFRAMLRRELDALYPDRTPATQ